MNVQTRVKPNSIMVLALVFLQVLSVSLTLLNVQELPKSAEGKITQFADALGRNDYVQAKKVYNDLQNSLYGTLKDGAVAKLTGVLRSKIESTSEKILQEKNGFQTLTEEKGLELFYHEGTGMIQEELQRVKGMYVNKSISYEDMDYYLENIGRLGFTSEMQAFRTSVELIHDSRQYLKQAEQLAKTKDYLAALQNFQKVSPEEQESFAKGQRKMKQCLDEMYHANLEQAGVLAGEQKYKEATETLQKIASFYPNDAKLTAKIAEYKKAQDMILYQGPIEHIFFHPLLAYPGRAFDNDSQTKGFNDWFVTVKEFRKILDSLYKNNFILVDIHALYETKSENGAVRLQPKTLLLPKGKKPLVLSVDDLNYYKYMIENGTVNKLVLDSGGYIAASSVNSVGEEVISHDNEIIPILDEFVKEHEDFSLNGTKGMINLTGYEGVLGYRTGELDSPQYENEKNQALMVIKRLKETGWTFASHGYGHLDARKISLGVLERDTERWLKEVEPLIGPTDVYVYPFGSSVLPGDPKFQLLLDRGFHVLCSVGPNPYLKFGQNNIMMDRRHIDGIALHYQEASLKGFFDSAEVIDSVRPPFVP